jgi:hypothetical protein
MESLSSVRQRLADFRARTSTLIVPTAGLRLDDGGRLVSEGQTFALGPQARSEIARRASIPSEFFAKCSGDIQAFLFNRLYAENLERSAAGESTQLVLLGGSLVWGITDPELAFLHADEVLETALAARPETIDEAQLEVVDFHHDGDAHISVVSPAVQTEARVGDIVRAGLDIYHSNIGQFGTQIESYVFRLSCRNGMLIKVCRHSHATPARIRRAATENRGLTRRRVEEMARMAWNELDAKLTAVRLMAEERVDNVAAVIQSVGEKLRFGERLIQQVLNALASDEIGPSGTLWDIACAFSRTGTHSDNLSLRTRRYFQELSGDFVRERIERCPTCGALRRGTMRYLPRR